MIKERFKKDSALLRPNAARQNAPNQITLKTNAANQNALQANGPPLILPQHKINAPAKQRDLTNKIIEVSGAVTSSRFPTLIINRNFTIISVNDACEKLFTDYKRLKNRFFFDVFGKHMGIDGIKKMRNVVLNGEDGYSWRGTIDIKTHDQPTINTLFFIFPADDEEPPEEFVLLFDDFTKEKKSQLHDIFKSLLDASKLKDNDTGEHINRVNYYAEALARELYKNPKYPIVDAEYIEDIGFLAAMHDVGKIGTPDNILTKAGPLSDAEFATMREHTTNGAFILDAYPNAMAKEIALSHHERWDGKGYPYKWSGDMIPLHARIVSISDVYDALRMQRSYKPALTHSETMQRMQEGRGTQFDPKLFDIFVTIADAFNRIYESNKDKG